MNGVDRLLTFFQCQNVPEVVQFIILLVVIFFFGRRKDLEMIDVFFCISHREGSWKAGE